MGGDSEFGRLSMVNVLLLYDLFTRTFMSPQTTLQGPRIHQLTHTLAHQWRQLSQFWPFLQTQRRPRRERRDTFQLVCILSFYVPQRKPNTHKNTSSSLFKIKPLFFSMCWLFPWLVNSRMPQLLQRQLVQKHSASLRLEQQKGKSNKSQLCFLTKLAQRMRRTLSSANINQPVSKKKICHIEKGAETLKNKLSVRSTFSYCTAAPFVNCTLVNWH